MRIHINILGALLAGAIWALGFCSQSVHAAPDSQDLLPPKVEIVSPGRDAIIKEDRPRIAVSFSDEGSGIDIASVRMALDHVDVTSSSQITELGVTYVPPIPLSPGGHEVVLQVADRAGNTAQVAWSFKVAPARPVFEGVKLGGTSTLRLDMLPLLKVTERLSLNLQTRFGGTSVEAKFGMDAEGGPLGWGEPVSPQTFQCSAGDYSISIRGERFSLALGEVSIPFRSAFLLPQFPKDGAFFSLGGGVSPARGVSLYSFGAFRGTAVSSQGFGIRVLNFHGASCLLSLGNGSDISGTMVLAEERGAATNLYSLKWTGRISPSVNAELEVGQSRDEDEGRIGNALSLTFDGRVGTAVFGVEIRGAEPNFRSPLSPEFPGGTGGTGKLRLRASCVLGGRVLTSLDAVHSRDNLGKMLDATTSSDNALLSLDYSPTSMSSLRASYYMEREESSGGISGSSTTGMHKVTLSMDQRLKVFRSPSVATLSYSDSASDNGAGSARVASLALSSSFPYTTVKGMLEATRKEVPRESATVNAIGADVSIQPDISFGKLKVAGQIQVGYGREEKAFWEEPRMVQRTDRTNLAMELSVRLTPQDTVKGTYKHSWKACESGSLTRDQDYQLFFEYRRNL